MHCGKTPLWRWDMTRTQKKLPGRIDGPRFRSGGGLVLVQSLERVCFQNIAYKLLQATLSVFPI
jgi:hypothetical protein